MKSITDLSQSVLEVRKEICQKCLRATTIRFTRGRICKRCLGKSLEGNVNKYLRLAATVKRLRDEKRKEAIKNKRLLEEIRRLEKIIKALTL